MSFLWLSLLLCFASLFQVLHATHGDADPIYRACVEQCEDKGYIGDISIKHCQFSSDALPDNSSWYEHKPFYSQWKQWNCKSDCQYHCMIQRENERQTLGLMSVKYHGKWPFKRVFFFQEPVSAIISALSLVVQFKYWHSFYQFLHYKLPLRPQSQRTYYEFTGLWHISCLLSMNSSFWGAILHSRYSDLAERLDYTSSVILLGISLILALLRTLNVKNEASRVMVAAPLLAFLTTHCLYLNFYQFDHGLNMIVCMAMGIAQVLLWIVWASLTSHPARLKLWIVFFGGALAKLLEIYELPPYNGYVDAHALWHAFTIPLTYLWWSFIKEDAKIRTLVLTKKTN
ncbi:hypothetical protein J5N97_021708 [Dioscorea zingiberensis]|uniref:Post-GPI attachment to proteins factor 3 n=1 Tax=Dioscorea zingiberensis TaxID=325984 RepID=A0A9D5C8V5_9LILI|nr:hypothetical protein J5N97_021708 [Dioscorea zingiberensis]